VVGQFDLEYFNNNSLHAGYIKFVLHKTTIANKLSMLKQGPQFKIQVVGKLFKCFT